MKLDPRSTRPTKPSAGKCTSHISKGEQGSGETTSAGGSVIVAPFALIATPFVWRVRYAGPVPVTCLLVAIVGVQPARIELRAYRQECYVHVAFGPRARSSWAEHWGGGRTGENLPNAGEWGPQRHLAGENPPVSIDA